MDFSRSSAAAWRRLGVTLVVLGAALLANPAPSFATNVANESVARSVLRELSAAWWQWALSIPRNVHPLAVRDRYSARNCGIGQHGDVWFLGGSFSSSVAERKCTIPAGVSIFFPVVNAECSEIEGNGSTLGELRSCAASLMDEVTVVRAEVDGVPLDLDDARVKSGLFAFKLPRRDVLGLFRQKPNPSPAASDGWYVLLPPLPVGEHTITFGASVPAFDFELDIAYTVDIVD